MKAKKFNKRLGLNKKTIANLSVKDMNLLKGGIEQTEIGHACSNPCVTDICPTRKPTCW